jgi:small subunit ribosomal protein S16
LSVKIRLKRMGKKKQPFYRIVVSDKDSPRDGRIIQSIGYYDPLKTVLKIAEEEAMEWLKKGAIPTPTVNNLFKKQGINKKFHEFKFKKD